MTVLEGKRGIYVITGALLTTFVVTSGTLLTYLLITPEIQKGKDRTALDAVRNSLRDLDTRMAELLADGVNSTSIFTMVLPNGVLKFSPDNDTLAYSVKTRVNYNPGSTSKLTTLTARRSTGHLLTVESQLPVDLDTRYTAIRPGTYVVELTFEKESILTIDKWTLDRNATYGVLASKTNNYYISKLSEATHASDLNSLGVNTDSWMLYLSDPNEAFVFDTVAVHNTDSNRTFVLGEDESFRLSPTVPLMVYRVRERYVVFRYAMIRMELR